jgi:hypothetical protein
VGAKATLAVVAAGLALGGVAWLVRDGAATAQPARPEAQRAIAPVAPQAAAEPPPDAVVAVPAAGPARDEIAARTSAEERAPELSGRTLDDRGVPLAGVRVAVLNEIGDDTRVSTTSDAAGTFSLALGDLAAPADGAWRVQAQLEGHVPLDFEHAGPELGDLVLPRRPRVSGTLLRPDGTPAAPRGRADLSVVDASGEQRWWYAEIDPGGRFEVSVDPGRLLEARGKARGFAPGETHPDLELAPGSSHELTLTLTAGDVVRGVVVDAASEAPVPFAEVWSESWVYDAESIEPSSVADEHGRFELRGVRATTVDNDQGPTQVVWVDITARAPGYLGRPFEPTVLRRNDDGELGQLVIRIGRADASVAGRVTWPDGSAAEGVPIYTVDDGMNLKFAQSDGEGLFELAGLAPGRLAICARTSPEFPERPSGRADANVELAAGARVTCDLVLALPGERIAGRVLDQHGAGVPGIVIEAGEHFFTGKLTVGMGHHRATTDAEGRYEFTRLSPARYQVEIEGAQRRERAAAPSHHSIDLVAGEPREDVDFELVPAVVHAGWIDVGEHDPSDFEVLRVRPADGEVLERQTVRSDGRFRFEGCWPEACAIALVRESRELARVEVGAAGSEGTVLAAPR